MGFSVVRGLQALALIGFAADLGFGAVMFGRHCLPDHLKSQSLIEHAGVKLPGLGGRTGSAKTLAQDPTVLPAGLRLIERSADGRTALALEIGVDGARRAVLWSREAGAHDIAAPTGEVFEPQALSADGQTVGGALDDATGQHAVIWTRASGFQRLGVDGMFAAVHAVSSNGLTAVGDHQGPSGSGVFRWTRANGAQDIVPEAAFTAAADDVATILAVRYSQGGDAHLVRWTPMAGAEDIGPAPSPTSKSTQ